MLNINLAKEKVIFIGMQYHWDGHLMFPLVNVISTMSSVAYNDQKHIIVNTKDYEKCL